MNDRLPSPEARRNVLLAEMHRLGAVDATCASCSGLCCTQLANSMQITPVETRDLFESLRAEGRLTDGLRTALSACIGRYRLDVDVGDGRRSLRRTYTCPFYTPGPAGCSIAPTHKPYGCLAFNPRRSGVRNGEACASDQQLLATREQAFPEEARENAALCVRHGLLWQKAPIPVALLAYWQAVER